MSTPESSLGSTASPAAPPPSAPSPAAAPPVATPSPVAAPSTPVDTAVPDSAEAIINDAVAPSEPGALPSQSERPKTVAEAQALYRQRLTAGEEGAQLEAAPAEAQPIPEPAPVEAQPEEEAAPVVEPVETAPEEVAAPVEAEGDDTDYREHIYTPDEIDAQFARQLSKKARADYAAREAHRGEMAKTIDTIGGDLGVQLASVLNPIILGKDEPTADDVNAIFDQILLPENAGAGKLFDLMGKELVNTQLQEKMCGTCQADGNKPNAQCTDHLPMGREFASNMISEEWGKNEDGTSFDFHGMKPIELVDFLIRAAKAKDDEGDSLVNIEFLKTELEGKGKAKPSERELALQRENEELRNSTQAERAAKEAEQTREREQAKTQYVAQAKGYVSRQIMAEVTPLAVKANWAASEGEEGPQVGQKQILGRLVAADINSHLMGSPEAPTPEYAAVKKMIDERTAFDPVTGLATPRFKLKLKPLQTMAKARFNETIRELGSQFKFAAESSRNAQLVKKNGSQVRAQQPANEAAPPLTTVQPRDPNKPQTAEELLEGVRREYREKKAAALQQAGVR